MSGGSAGNGNGRNLGGLWHDSRLDLSDKAAVVTGGARGIGQATCVALALEGARAVAVVDQSDDLAAFVQQGNERLGREVFIAFRGDVTQSVFRRAVFAEMERRFGAVSICVPAAGIIRDRLGVKIERGSGQAIIYPEDDFRRVVEIDMTAPIYWSLETIASVARSRHARGLKRWEPSEPMEGAIVLIGSVSSEGNRGQISYATAKAGLEGAQGTLATEAIYYGVRCAIIHPGYTDTQMVRSLGEEFISENIIPRTQLRRLIRPDEIANAIVFLVRNAVISGQVWADAGWHPSA
jgi:NAD(P)-dependent dehydrogenase (short-subunit alcohol dehydrogenase family)